MYKKTFRTNKKGVPILKNYEIDDIAERELRDYDEQLLHNPARIDVDKFVRKHLGLKQDYQDLTNKGIKEKIINNNNENYRILKANKNLLKKAVEIYSYCLFGVPKMFQKNIDKI